MRSNFFALDHGKEYDYKNNNNSSNDNSNNNNNDNSYIKTREIIKKKYARAFDVIFFSSNGCIEFNVVVFFFFFYGLRV